MDHLAAWQVDHREDLQEDHLVDRLVDLQVVQRVDHPVGHQVDLVVQVGHFYAQRTLVLQASTGITVTTVKEVVVS